jgi:ribosomal small subunit protein bTHX
MGRGDKKTTKGKRFKGSYGNSRPAKVKKAAATPTAKKATAPKKAATKKATAPKKAAAKKETASQE